MGRISNTFFQTAISALLIAVPFFTKAQNQREKIHSYYAFINKHLTEFVNSRDSLILEDVYKQVLTWDHLVLCNAFTQELEDAVEYYNRKQDFPNAYLHFKKLVACGKSIKTLQNLTKETEYKSFFSSVYGDSLFLSYAQLHESYKRNIELSYYALSFELTSVDQFARTFIEGGNENYFGGSSYAGFNFLNDSLKNLIGKATVNLADSLCFEQIIEYYNKYGFPSSSKCGKGGLGFIYAHLFIDCVPIYSSTGINSVIFLDSIMKAAVFEGEISALEYAFWKDNSTNPHSRACENVFSTYATPHNIGGGKKEISGKILDIKNLDTRRKEIMLPPLYVSAIIGNFKLPLEYSMPINCPPKKQ